MTGYSIALYFHLLSLLLAIACTALTGHAALRMRAAATAEDAVQWLRLNGRIVPLLPLAGAGLLTTGAYMAHSLAAWSEPWLLASLVGLASIVVLGGAVDGSRSRALGRELNLNGLSPRARRMLRDPVAWTAKATIPALVLAVMFIMTTKPAAPACAAILFAAVIAGAVGARPLWQTPTAAGAARAQAN